MTRLFRPSTLLRWVGEMATLCLGLFLLGVLGEPAKDVSLISKVLGVFFLISGARSLVLHFKKGAQQPENK